jgi:hypothetical protein
VLNDGNDVLHAQRLLVEQELTFSQHRFDIHAGDSVVAQMMNQVHGVNRIEPAVQVMLACLVVSTRTSGPFDGGIDTERSQGHIERDG